MLFSSFSHPGQSFGQSCSILWGLLFSSLGSPVSFLDSSVRSLGSPVQFFGQPCSVLCAVLHSSQGSPIQFCGQSCQLVLWAVMYCSFGSPLNHLCSPVQFPGQPCSVSLLFSVLNLPSSPSIRFGPEHRCHAAVLTDSFVSEPALGFIFFIYFCYRTWVLMNWTNWACRRF